MNLSEVITQLKTYAPIFQNNVAGMADYELAKDQVWLQQPAAYVVPMDDDGGENQDLAGYQQIVRQTIAIIVDLDNSADRRGQTAAADAIADIRRAIWSALLNWRPDSLNPPLGVAGPAAARGFVYLKGGFLYADRARMRWQFDFGIDVTVTEQEGFQVPSDPLLDIRGTEIDQATGQPFATFDAALPQP